MSSPYIPSELLEQLCRERSSLAQHVRNPTLEIALMQIKGNPDLVLQPGRFSADILPVLRFEVAKTNHDWIPMLDLSQQQIEVLARLYDNEASNYLYDRELGQTLYDEWFVTHPADIEAIINPSATSALNAIPSAPTAFLRGHWESLVTDAEWPAIARSFAIRYDSAHADDLKNLRKIWPFLTDEARQILTKRYPSIEPAQKVLEALDKVPSTQAAAEGPSLTVTVSPRPWVVQLLSKYGAQLALGLLVLWIAYQIYLSMQPK